LGQGGFGITYVGLDLRLNRKVAIKEFLPASLAARDTSQQIIPLFGQEMTFAKGLHCFINEARHLARFDHVHIVRVSHYFEANQTGYMVMDYVQGESPIQLLKQHGGKLPLDMALKILFPVLDALSIMHTQQVFHLDVSAHNVLLLDNQQPVLIDFGAARHLNVMGEYTQSMTLVLKPGYSPLEQYSQGSDQIGPWTDVYACAALLYLLLVGKLPPPAIERWQNDSQVQALNLGKQKRDKRITQALLKGLALKVDQRPSNVATFKQLLSATPNRYSVSYWGYLSTALLAGSMTWAYLPLPSLLPAPSINAPAQQVDSTPSSKPTIMAVQSELVSSIISKPIALVEQVQGIAPISPLQQAINKLLNQAHILENSQQLEAAYQSYQAVLKLEIQQTDAIQGLTALAWRYNQLAQQQDNLPLRQQLLQQGLRYFPDQSQLKQQWTQLQQQQQSRQIALNQQKQRAQHIKTYLKQAKQQRRAQKLTTPKNDNAHQSYQKILALNPRHIQAKQGLQHIAEQYSRWASKQTDLNKRTELIKKGLSVIPNHQALLSLQKQTDFLRVDQEKQRRHSNQQEAIQIMLTQARKAIQNQQWNTANRYYQQILLRDEQQAEAQQGLQTLVAYYLSQAQQQGIKGRLSDSLLSISKGLAIMPKDEKLLAQQQQIQNSLDQNNALANQSMLLPELDIKPEPPTVIVSQPAETPVLNRPKAVLLTPSF